MRRRRSNKQFVRRDVSKWLIIPVIFSTPVLLTLFPNALAAILQFVSSIFELAHGTATIVRLLAAALTVGAALLSKRFRGFLRRMVAFSESRSGDQETENADDLEDAYRSFALEEMTDVSSSERRLQRLVFVLCCFCAVLVGIVAALSVSRYVKARTAEPKEKAHDARLAEKGSTSGVPAMAWNDELKLTQRPRLQVNYRSCGDNQRPTSSSNSFCVVAGRSGLDRVAALSCTCSNGVLIVHDAHILSSGAAATWLADQSGVERVICNPELFDGSETNFWEQTIGNGLGLETRATVADINTATRMLNRHAHQQQTGKGIISICQQATLCQTALSLLDPDHIAKLSSDSKLLIRAIALAREECPCHQL